MLGPTTGRADYRDAQVAVVVSVTWAGRTWRVSQQALTVGAVDVVPGLVESPEVSDEISLEAGGDIGVSVPVAVVLPAVDVLGLVDAGYDPADMRLEVAWVWHRNGVAVHEWAARDVRAEGSAIEPVWGAPDQPAGYIACTVEDSPYRTERPLCRWAWEVSESTWATSPEHGARYPLVMGRPDPLAAGGGPPAPVLTQTGTPNNLTALVSIGWCSTTAVTLIDSSGTADVLDITYESDSLGQVCAIVDLTGSALDRSDGTTYTTAWTAGAALAPMGGRGPLHLAAYLLSVGGAAIALSEWLSAATLLRLEVGGWVNDPETMAWEVARDLLSGLPVTMRRSRDGWAPVIIDPALAEHLAETAWDEGGPYRQVSAWTEASATRAARVEVSSDGGEVQVGASLVRDAGLPHAWVRHLPQTDEIGQHASWSWRASAPRRLAAWQARIGAMGWEVAAFQVPPEWAIEQAGQWVYLSGDDRFALVVRRTLTGGVWDYSLARPRGR